MLCPSSLTIRVSCKIVQIVANAVCCRFAFFLNVVIFGAYFYRNNRLNSEVLNMSIRVFLIAIKLKFDNDCCGVYILSGVFTFLGVQLNP